MFSWEGEAGDDFAGMHGDEIEGEEGEEVDEEGADRQAEGRQHSNPSSLRISPQVRDSTCCPAR